MAVYKQIAYASASSGTTVETMTNAFEVPTDFTEFAIQVPALLGVTATIGVQVYGATSNVTFTSFFPVYYPNAVGTVTSNSLISIWQSPNSAACLGGFVVCEALKYCPGWARFHFTATMTMLTGITVYGRKYD